MIMKKQYLIIILTFLFLLLGTTISFGAYNASSSTVESGGKITVKVTSTEALEAYNLDLSSSDGLTFNSCSKTETGAIININGSSIGYMNMSGNTKELGTYNFTAPKVTKDTVYTVSFLVDKKTTVTSKITVKAPVVETPKEPVTPPTTTTPEPETPPATVTKSSEARLSNLGIKPNDFSGFKRDKYEYSTTVPNEVAEVEVYAEKVDSKATIEGTGKVSLKEGDNKISVKVTAEDGKTTKTYNLTIKRKTAAEEENENGEARLKSLGIKPKEYDFTGFDSEKTEYSVEVPNEVEEIEVYATAMNSKAQITGTGMIELKEGLNELVIEVIAANGDKKSYTLKVTREEADETVGTTEEKLGLSTLIIEGLKLNPSFKSDIYEYTATITYVMVGNSLDITAKANNQDAEVEIIGNENLQDGENIITILVKNEETEENATYQITVNKKVEVEIVEKTSWLKPSTWGKEEIIKVAIIIVLIILIISAIILKIKISKEGNKPVAKDLPGADELDKAIAEHQELSEEVNSEANLENEEVRQNYIEEIAMNRFDAEDFGEKPRRKGRHF